MRALLMTLDWPPVCGGIASYCHELMSAMDPTEVAVLTTRSASPYDDSETPFPVLRLSRDDRSLRTQRDFLMAMPEVKSMVRELAPDWT